MRAEAMKLAVWCFLADMVSSWTVLSPLQKTRDLDGFRSHMSDPFSSNIDHMNKSNMGDENSLEDDQDEEPEGQANTRFSKFAPDTNLSTDDFRAQLKANMKADLERRRREDPNRGNQLAKSYLDSL
mmetsp:Transcript_2842/g.6693  ORF Transcript_2842/g.6693 Transcript_2842/m.6693 type:complete len:127 (+) Transcript_2842:60-440(+)